MAWTEYSHPGITDPKGTVPVRDGVLVVQYTDPVEGIFYRSGVLKTSTTTIVVPVESLVRLDTLNDPLDFPPNGSLLDYIIAYSYVLRMYDIPGNEVQDWFVKLTALNGVFKDADNNTWTPADFYDPALVPALDADPWVASYLSWLDSRVAPDLTTTDGTPGSRTLLGSPTEFVIDFGTAPLGQTAIATRRYSPGEVVEVLSGYDDPIGRPTVTSTVADLMVRYKDPCVVEIPTELGGGFLCLMGRYRVVVVLSEAQLAQDLSDPMIWDQVRQESSGEGSPEPHNSIGDIVGWVCNDPSFSGPTLKGPYLFLSSIGQLADPEVADGRASGPAFAPFRVWAGVPSAAFVHGDLHLFGAGHPNGREGSDPSVLTPYLDEADGFDAAVAAFAGGKGFDQAVLTRRIRGDVFRAQVVDAAPIPEAEWTYDDAVGGVLAATVLRRRGGSTMDAGPAGLFDRSEAVWPARIMLGQPGSSRRCIPLVDAIEAAMQDADLTEHRDKGLWPPLVTDPSPAVCGGGLSLYVSAVPGMGAEDLSLDADTLHGIWRTAAIPEGTTIDVWTGSSWSRRQANFGVDFVAAAVGLTTKASRDLVARSRKLATKPPGYKIYLDPDPRPLTGWAERVRVYVGCDGPVESTLGSLTAFEADDSVACQQAEEAWGAHAIGQWRDPSELFPTPTGAWQPASWWDLLQPTDYPHLRRDG